MKKKAYKTEIIQVHLCSLQNRGQLNKNCLYRLDFSIAVPYMTYCVEVWGTAHKRKPDPIFKLQKRTTRIIGVGYHDSTNKLYIRSHTLKYQDTGQSKILEIVFHVGNKKIPV